MRLINSDGQVVNAKVSAGAGGSANRNDLRVSFGGLVGVVCAALCGIAVPIALWAGYAATQAEQEARMLQYYVNEVDGKLIHAGFIEPRERWSPSWKPAPPKQEKQP